MTDQIDLFPTKPQLVAEGGKIISKNLSKVSDKPRPPACLTEYIHKVQHHDQKVIIFRENKASTAPSVAYFFTGTMQGRAIDLKATMATTLFAEYPPIQDYLS